MSALTYDNVYITEYKRSTIASIYTFTSSVAKGIFCVGIWKYKITICCLYIIVEGQCALTNKRAIHSCRIHERICFIEVTYYYFCNLQLQNRV